MRDSGLLVALAAVEARDMAQAVIHFDRAGIAGSTQAVQGASDCIEFALNQDRIAAVQIAASNQSILQWPPFGKVLDVFGGGTRFSEAGQ